MILLYGQQNIEVLICSLTLPLSLCRVTFHSFQYIDTCLYISYFFKLDYIIHTFLVFLVLYLIIP